MDLDEGEFSLNFLTAPAAPAKPAAPRKPAAPSKAAAAPKTAAPSAAGAAPRKTVTVHFTDGIASKPSVPSKAVGGAAAAAKPGVKRPRAVEHEAAAPAVVDRGHDGRAPAAPPAGARKAVSFSSGVEEGEDNHAAAAPAGGAAARESRKQHSKSASVRTPIIVPVAAAGGGGSGAPAASSGAAMPASAAAASGAAAAGGFSITPHVYSLEDAGLFGSAGGATGAAAFTRLGLDERLGSKLTAPKGEDCAGRAGGSFATPAAGASATASSGLVRGHLRDGFGLSRPTRVQTLMLPLALQGRSLLVKSETGSGKTLAFLLPILHGLLAAHASQPLRRSDGTRALIVAPTRELCQQIFGVLSRLAQPFPFLVPGIVAGGEKRKSEKARLRRGATVLVATPGRLLDHLRTTASFVCSAASLGWLVLDEADRLLDLGFGQQLREIGAAIRTRGQAGAASAAGGAAGSDEDEDEEERAGGEGEGGAGGAPSPLPHAGTVTFLLSATASGAVRSLAGDVLSADALFLDASAAAAAAAVARGGPSEPAGGSAAPGAAEGGSGSATDGAAAAAAGAPESRGAVAEGSAAAAAESCAPTFSAPKTLAQTFMLVPVKWRLVTLLGLVLQAAFSSQRSLSKARRERESGGAAAAAASQGRGTKAILFFSSCDAVDFHAALLRAVLPAVLSSGKREGDEGGAAPPAEDPFPIFRLHGNVPQAERTHVYRTFAAAGAGLLIATDVAARGLDMPAVDLILQADAPAETGDYVHRIGRTARRGARGAAVLLLQPHEAPYADLLRAAGLDVQSADTSAALACLAHARMPLHMIEQQAAAGGEESGAGGKPAAAGKGGKAGKGPRPAPGSDLTGLMGLGAAEAEAAAAAAASREAAEDGGAAAGAGAGRRTEERDTAGVPSRLSRLLQFARDTKGRVGMGSAATGSAAGGAAGGGASSMARVAEAFAQAWQCWLEELVLLGLPQAQGGTAAAAVGEGAAAARAPLAPLARKAWSSFVRAYSTHEKGTRHIFHPRSLHLGHAAKAFGLREAPAKVGREEAAQWERSQAALAAEAGGRGGGESVEDEDGLKGRVGKAAKAKGGAGKGAADGAPSAAKRSRASSALSFSNPPPAAAGAAASGRKGGAAVGGGGGGGRPPARRAAISEFDA